MLATDLTQEQITALNAKRAELAVVRKRLDEVVARSKGLSEERESLDDRRMRLQIEISNLNHLDDVASKL